MNLGLRGEGTRGGEDGSLRVQVFCKEDIDLLIEKYNHAQIKNSMSFYYVSTGENSRLARGNRQKSKK